MLTTACTKEQYESLRHTRYVSTTRGDLKIDNVQKVIGIKWRGEYSVIGFKNKDKFQAAIQALLRG